MAVSQLDENLENCTLPSGKTSIMDISIRDEVALISQTDYETEVLNCNFNE